MGAPRIRPAPNAACVDAIWIAEQIGRPVGEVYRQAREGVLPKPIAGAMERGESPSNWRWSRRRVLDVLEGAS